MSAFFISQRIWAMSALAAFFAAIATTSPGQYYYPSPQQYPRGYYPGYAPQPPPGYGYPQQQQQQRRPAPQSERSRPAPQGASSGASSSPSPAPTQTRKPRKDISDQQPPNADISKIENGPLVAYTWDDRDSLKDLASATGLTNSQILALNHLAASQLRDGQVLRVPPLAQTTSSLKIARDPQTQLSREVWRGIRGKRRIALTFDAGGGKDGLEDLLKALNEASANATFFMTGEFAKKHPRATRSIMEAGFPIFNHSWSHPEFTKVSEAEMKSQLTRTDDILTSITGRTTRPFWRPPFGDRNRKVLQTAAETGFQSIYWTLDSLDSVDDKKSAEFVADRVLNPPMAKANPDGYLDGAIILMHVGETGTAAAVPRIISELRKRGFTLVTVDQLLKP